MFLGSPGFYEFRLCDEGLETQACFDKYLLTIVDHDTGTNSSRIPVPATQGLNIIHLQLPVGVTCDFCTLQWRFRKGKLMHMYPHLRVRVHCIHQSGFHKFLNVKSTCSVKFCLKSSIFPKKKTPWCIKTNYVVVFFYYRKQCCRMRRQ